MSKTIFKKLTFEKQCLEQGNKYIAGVDEVGRGPLAGPVVCAAVIMPLDKSLLIEGIDDSKNLSAKRREELFEIITRTALAVKIHEIDNQEIDSINILEAVKLCMKICVENLPVKPDIILSDAICIDTDIPQINIVKGDSKSYSIGAASIVAKVYRDNLMKNYHDKFPQYNFAAHKGYGTKTHIEMIKEYGPCEIHRKSFIKNFWDSGESARRQSF